MWIKFISQKPYAVQVFVGGVNAVSGKPLVQPSEVTTASKPKASASRGNALWSDHPGKSSAVAQDYMVVPEQKWIDGIATSPGMVRQFVAMPSGSGYSVEVQVTGKEEFAGMLFSVTPRMSPSTSAGFHTRQRTVEVNISTLGGRRFKILASRDDTVDDLKHLIQQKEKIQPLQSQLSLDGHMLAGK